MEKKCNGSRILIEHYFLNNPNATVKKKYAENLGICALCWFYIPGKSYSYIKPTFHQKSNECKPERDSL